MESFAEADLTQKKTQGASLFNLDNVFGADRFDAARLTVGLDPL